MPLKTVRDDYHQIQVPTSASVNHRPVHLPIVAIAGAIGKTTTAWLLVDILENSGMDVGAWLSNGVYIDHQIRKDELHAWELAVFAARAKELDALVQEIPSVLAGNLPAGSLPISVLTSICGSDDQCRHDSDTNRDRKAAESIIRAVAPEGHVVANADDLVIVEETESASCKKIYYAMNHRNPVLGRHLESGGDACWIQNGWVKVQFNRIRVNVVAIADLPSTLGGHLIFQVQNALAAIAAALPFLGDKVAIAPNGKRISGTDGNQVRGGTTIINNNNRTIIVDRPKSIQSIRQIARAVRSFGAKRVILSIDGLEMFDEEDAGEAARILGTIAGIAIITGHSNNTDRLNLIKIEMMKSDDPPVIIRRDDLADPENYFNSILDSGDIALSLGSFQRSHT